VIVSYTSQPTSYSLKNNQNSARNFDTSLTQETTQSSRTTAAPPSKLTVHFQSTLKQNSLSNAAGPNAFKQKTSFLPSFAIQQYTMLDNLEIQKAKSAILGFSEYA